jgi:hypothetical protein
MAYLFLLAASAGLQAPIEPVRTVTMSEKRGSLDIPDEIAPAVVPFMMCRLRAAGVRVRRPDGTIPESATPSGEDCTPVRSAAKRNAITMLKQKGIKPKGGRESFVERTLDDIVSFTTYSMELPVPQESAGNLQGQPNEVPASEIQNAPKP